MFPQGGTMVLRNAEELLDFSQHLHKAVSLRRRVVEVKTGAGGGFNPQLAHQRLVAVVPAAQRNAALVSHGHHVMRVDIFQQEAHQPGPPDMRAEEPEALLEPGELGVSMGSKFLVVLRDILSPDLVEVIHRRVQAYCARNVGRARLKFVRGVLPRASLKIHVQDHFPAALIRRHVREHFLALFLDHRHQVTSYIVLATGTAASCPVGCRELFQAALAAGASFLIVGHNHTSGQNAGELFPSQEDLAVTHRLSAAGDLLGLPVLDHLIIGNEGHYSFSEQNQMRPQTP